jgi:hypothetical protein
VEQSHAKYALSIEERSPHDWAQLVCKLRWIGMPEEARRLELAVIRCRPKKGRLYWASHSAQTEELLLLTVQLNRT